MAYIDAIKELETKLFGFNEEAETIYNLINGLKVYIPNKQPSKEAIGNTTPEQIERNKLDAIIKLIFNEDSPVTDLVLFAIQYAGVLCKVSEIEAIIRKFSPSFNRGFSSAIYKLKSAGWIDTYNPSATETNPDGSNHYVYYGMKDWFIGKNQVKKEYLTKDIEVVIEMLSL